VIAQGGSASPKTMGIAEGARVFSMPELGAKGASHCQRVEDNAFHLLI
jgi:hypothetical protein